MVSVISIRKARPHPPGFSAFNMEPCRLTNDFLPSFWLNSQSSCVLTSSDFLPHAVVGMIPTETVAKRLQTLPTQNAVTGPVPDLLSTNTSII
jgi:hypothetical protein